MIQEKIKIGLFGTGKWGKTHLGQLKEIPGFEVIGFFEPNSDAATITTEKFGIKAWDNMDNLIAAADAIDIVTPTPTHFLCAKKALKKSRPVFIENPVTHSADEAKILLQLSREGNAKIMVSQPARFNATSIQLKTLDLKPLFIESQRHLPATSVPEPFSVIHDLMKLDLDIILQIIRFPIKKIAATAFGKRGKGPDLVNARLEFSNGCVANLTAGKNSENRKEKMRIFQADNCLTVDFIHNNCRFHSPGSTDTSTGGTNEYNTMQSISPATQHSNQTATLKMELESFEKMVRENEKPPVSLEDALHSLQTAFTIAEKIKNIEF